MYRRFGGLSPFRGSLRDLTAFLLAILRSFLNLLQQVACSLSSILLVLSCSPIFFCSLSMPALLLSRTFSSTCNVDVKRK